MEEELKNSVNAEVELIGGSDGVYDIDVDGKNIFSKKNLNRFPDNGEIVKLINAM